MIFIKLAINLTLAAFNAFSSQFLTGCLHDTRNEISSHYKKILFTLLFIFFIWFHFRYVYMIFYHRNEISFLSRWPQWNNTHNEFHFEVFHVKNWHKTFHFPQNEIFCKHPLRFFLTHSWWRFLSHRNQSID